MALALENANKVRQKARLMNLDTSAFYALKSFFLYWAQFKDNADLQIFDFSEAEADDADGTGKADAACKVHFVYIKKAASDTDNYFKLFDSATVDTTTTEQRLVLPLFISGETQVWQSNEGLPFANGVTVTQHTTSEGTADGSDGGSGFFIVSAA